MCAIIMTRLKKTDAIIKAQQERSEPLGKLKRKEHQNEYLINKASQNHIAIIPLKKPKVKTKTFLTLKGII